MRLLLDTHALLWWWTDDKQLSGSAREAIAEERNTVQVSAASVWEISTKFRLGKLAIAEPALKQFHQLIEADGFEHLPIAWQHSLLVGSYPNEHRDPFDRMNQRGQVFQSHTVLDSLNDLNLYRLSQVFLRGNVGLVAP